MKPAAVRFAAFLVGFYLLASGVQANAAIVITRSELSGGQLRVEGQGAQPNAPISVDGTARGTADTGGRFKILTANFSSPTCSVTVSDGVTSAAASLIGCTSAPPPPPPPPPPPVTVSGLTLNPTSAVPVTGNSVLGTVTLSAAAPAGGAVVPISSSDLNGASVPGGSVTVPAGATNLVFLVILGGTTAKSVTLSASFGGVTKTALLTLGPAAPPPPAPGVPSLSSVFLNPTSLVPNFFLGNTVNLGITLSAAPSADAVITLSSSNPAVATVPASVILSAGFTTAGASVTTVPVTVSTTVTISASFGGVTKTALLTVLPPPPVMISSLTLDFIAVAFRGVGIVTLFNNPPFADVTVALSSSNPLAATVPPTVTVRAGATRAAFDFSTLSVTAVTSVTITATIATSSISALLTITPITPPPAQNDCGSGGDAGDTRATATPITLPVTCTGAILPDFVDNEDVYTFTVPQAFDLLTVSLQNYAGGLDLYDPDGNVRLIAPPDFDSPAVFFFGGGWAFGYTVDRPGQWTLVLRPELLSQLVPSPNYTMHIHLGGGGNDCVSGRDPARVPPNVTDAPNQFSTLPLLGQEISCTGSLPFALDFDFKDQYVFPVLANEPVVITVLPDLPGSIGAFSGMIAVAGNPTCLTRGCNTDFGLTHVFPTSVSGNAFLQVAGSDGYRIQVATGAHHNGDCFTGADAGNSSSTATPLPVVWPLGCVGDISAADREDWYSFTAAGNEELVVRSTFAPFEVYDPDGVNRGRGQVGNMTIPDYFGGFMVDKPGDWRIRVATDIAPLPHFEGNYGFSVSRQTGAPGHDCNSGADAPAAGLFLTLPVTCQGDFLPFFDDGDAYLFQLGAGQTVNISMTPNPTVFSIALKDPNGVQRASGNNGGVVGTEGISFTADFPGTWALQVSWISSSGPDLSYSFSISASNPGTTVSSLALNLTSVTPGTAVQGTVTMSPAPTSPAVVLLSSSNTGAARPDSKTVTVPAGATSATFTVSTPASFGPPVTLSASFGGVSVTSTLVVNDLYLARVALTFTHVTGGTGLQGIVTMNTAVTSPVVVRVGSTNANVAHPVSGTVTVPAGATSATFNISTAPVAATSVVEIFASFGGTLTIPLQVTLPVVPATLALSPTSVVGPASLTGTVTLTAAAPAGGAVVVLSTLSTGPGPDFAPTPNPAVAQVPGSVTVPAGATSATFTVMASAVAAPSSAFFYASLGGFAVGARLDVSPAPPPPPPPPPPTLDTVSITLDEYIVSKKQLRVQATSTSKTATLQILVASTGALIGTLTNNGAGGFSGQLSWPVNPQNITAKSSAGGSATKAVVAK